MRSKLRQMAEQLATSLQARNEIIGLGIYGSVAYNRVTPFSDLDIFIITSESEHEPSVEHRLHDGIRVDFTWHTLDKWHKIQYAQPRYMPWYTVKALLLGTDDMILYDPQGIIKEKREKLCQEVTYEIYMGRIVASEINDIAERLMTAIWYEEEGLFLNAWNELAPWATNYLFDLLNEFTNHKSIEESLQALKITGLMEHVQKIIKLKCAVKGFTPEYVRRLYELDKAHWEYQLERIWQPLQRYLIAQGVSFHQHLAVVGELILCYGGTRIYELERAIMEHSFSLEWGKYKLECGYILDALDIIRYEDIINDAAEKWTRIDDAITASGYDTGTIIKVFLASDEFRERTKVARKALDSPDAIQVTAAHTHQLITSVYEYLRLLSEYWVSHYPDLLTTMPELFSLSRAEILRIYREREIPIDNDFVSIIVSKEKAGIKSLVFKSGTNSDLIEVHWNNACLLDLSSASHPELQKKWVLKEKDIGNNEANFTFSQDGGYEVRLGIEWSQTGVAAAYKFQLPHPVAINNNIAIGGIRWPKPRNDYWAVTINGKVETGNYAYKFGPHAFIYPSDGKYFTPEGCWIAAWNEETDEVYGFTFSPNCGCIIAIGAGTDFEFYLPAGELIIRFHVAKPKPLKPYMVFQQWAVGKGIDPFISGNEEPRSPYLKSQ